MAYVTFADPSNAVTAYKALDKKSFQGRLLHILPAVDRKGKAGDQSGKPKTVKEDKEAKRKAMAGKAFNWAMLYMNVCTFEQLQYISFSHTSILSGSRRVMLFCHR